MARIGIENVHKNYGDVVALKPFSLDIFDGEFVVLVGPSGCGKSTMLKILAGLEPASGGRVVLGDSDVTDLAPGDRDVAMVFQNYALYPHLSVPPEHRLRIEDARHEPVGNQPASRGSRQDSRRGASPGPQAARAIRRAAATRRSRARHRQGTAGVPHGRTPVESRRKAPGPHAGRDQRLAQPDRRHHGLRHPTTRSRR